MKVVLGWSRAWWEDHRPSRTAHSPEEMANAEGGGEKELSGTRLNKLCIALILHMSMDLIIVTYICLMSYILKDTLVK